MTDAESGFAGLRRDIVRLGDRLIKWGTGVAIVTTMAVGGMIWAAVEALLHALPHR
jgi:hypothetical protein